MRSCASSKGTLRSHLARATSTVSLLIVTRRCIHGGRGRCSGLCSKLVSHIVSIFTGTYVFQWSKYMSIPLESPPSFDGRLVVYPSAREVRDYFAWRQADST